MRLLSGCLVALLCANFTVLGQSNEVKVIVLSSWGTGANSGYSAPIEVKPTGNVTSLELSLGHVWTQTQINIRRNAYDN